jgi:PTS system fructose-specific IIC component
MKIVAITSCATGIAHTYMAAEALERAGKAAGHEMVVETQGAGGFKPISADVIAGADVVIFANDVGIREKERFNNSKIVQSTPKAAIKNAADLIKQAEELANS